MYISYNIYVYIVWICIMRCGVYVGLIYHRHFFFRSESPCEDLSIGACCKQRKFRRTAFRTRLCVAQIRISSNLLVDFVNLPEETEILDVTLEMAPPKPGLRRSLFSFLHHKFKHLKSNGPISCHVQQASKQWSNLIWATNAGHQKRIGATWDATSPSLPWDLASMPFEVFKWATCVLGVLHSSIKSISRIIMSPPLLARTLSGTRPEWHWTTPKHFTSVIIHGLWQKCWHVLVQNNLKGPNARNLAACEPLRRLDPEEGCCVALESRSEMHLQI